MIESVIFDVDGTLVDTVDLHARAWQQALRHFGKDVPLDAIRQHVGKGGDQTMPVFLSTAELATYGKELDAYKSQLYRREYMPQAKPFPKVRELFLRLRQDNKRIALCTSAEIEELEYNKKLLQVDDLIAAETSARDAKRTKPFPDVFYAVLRKLSDPPPETAMVVGDSPYDAQAAAQVPLATIGLLCGGYAEKLLRDAGCIAIYRDPADLLAHYEQSPLVAVATTHIDRQ
jgi:HAD superfamily hydrolase (TIGR01509 family)